MNTNNTERRRYSRGGLFARIEDVTFQVLRKAERESAPRVEGADQEFLGDEAIPPVNVTFGPSGSQQLGEPF